MKHPTKRQRNDVWVVLPDRAIAIIESMPKRGEFIFPHNAGSIGTAFKRACVHLGIEYLTYHDLRHEGVSHLFELGLLSPEVMQVSGHTRMQTLERYLQFERRGDKYADWPWLDRVIQPETEAEARAFAKTRMLATRRKAQKEARDQRAIAGNTPPKPLPRRK
jgi:integrase